MSEAPDEHKLFVCPYDDCCEPIRDYCQECLEDWPCPEATKTD